MSTVSFFKDQIGSFCNFKLRKISLLHGDPFFEKALMKVSGALQDPLSLQSRTHGAKHRKVIRLAKGRVLRIASLKDQKPPRNNGNGVTKPSFATEIGLIGKGFSFEKRLQHLFCKALPIQISSNLQKALFRSLMWPEKEIVQVDHLSAKGISKERSQRRLTRSAGTVDGDGHKLLFLKKRGYFGKQFFHLYLWRSGEMRLYKSAVTALQRIPFRKLKGTVANSTRVFKSEMAGMAPCAIFITVSRPKALE